MIDPNTGLDDGVVIEEGQELEQTGGEAAEIIKGDDDRTFESKYRETERKLLKQKKENEEIRAELEEVRSMIKSKDTTDKDLETKRKELKESGHEDLLEFIDAAIAKREAALEQKYRQTSRRESIFNAIKRDDKRNIIAKYEDEINEVLDRCSPEVLGDRTAMSRVINMVLGEHLEDIISPTKKSSNVGKENISEDGPAGTGVKKDTAADREIKEFAQAQGLDITLPGVKQKIIAALNAKKKSEKES